MSAPTFANTPEALGTAANGFVPESLEREVRKIYARSPLYGQRFPLHGAPLQWSCFREIPALSKKEIVERGHQAFFADYGEIERGFAAKKFEYESTGGTTQSPMTIIMEEGWWNAQTERAYRASPILREFAGRPYRRFARGDAPPRPTLGRPHDGGVSPVVPRPRLNCHVARV